MLGADSNNWFLVFTSDWIKKAPIKPIVLRSNIDYFRREGNRRTQGTKWKTQEKNSGEKNQGKKLSKEMKTRP